MITRADMCCVECGSRDTALSVQVDRGSRRLVRFRVDCATHGGFSHYLRHGPVQMAVKDYLDALQQKTEAPEELRA